MCEHVQYTLYFATITCRYHYANRTGLETRPRLVGNVVTVSVECWCGLAEGAVPSLSDVCSCKLRLVRVEWGDGLWWCVPCFCLLLLPSSAKLLADGLVQHLHTYTHYIYIYIYIYIYTSRSTQTLCRNLTVTALG